jgi:IS30 family transposase
MCCYEKAKYVWDMQKAGARGKKRFRGQIRDVEKRLYIEKGLIDKEWSPEIIKNKMPEEIGKTTSVSTIYRYVKRNSARLKRHLYERGKPRKQRVAHRRGRFKHRERLEKKYIDQRPAIINSRIQFGHWEGDLVLGPKKGSGYVLLSLIERKTRLKVFIRMPNAQAQTTLAYLKAFLMQLPLHARRSITLDNGSEFSVFSMHNLEKTLKNFKVYYTDTYSPQQKGSDEHSNGRLRRAYPKKTDFAFIPNSELKLEVQKLNDRPMKLHSYRTPQEMFNLELRLAELSIAA